MTTTASLVDGLLARVRKNAQGEFVLERGDVLAVSGPILALDSGDALFTAVADSVRLFDTLAEVKSSSATLQSLVRDLLEPAMARLQLIAKADVASGALQRLKTQVKARGESWATKKGSGGGWGTK